MRRALLAVPVVLAIAGLWAYQTVQVHRAAARDDAQTSDVIVVLGAAEYHGQPSPVLRARLDHALHLYRRQLAPRIMTTGGAGGDPVFTEGEVARDYLIAHGVEPEAVIVERETESTVHQAAAVHETLRRMKLDSCIVVTDGYHMHRAVRMLTAKGIDAHGSPRPTDALDSPAYWWLCARQAAGYLLWSAGIAI